MNPESFVEKSREEPRKGGQCVASQNRMTIQELPLSEWAQGGLVTVSKAEYTQEIEGKEITHLSL